MLLKSRAEGDGSLLREEDRFYLEVFVVDETRRSAGEGRKKEEEAGGAGGATTYRYFSRFANADRVASAMSPFRDGVCTVELLVVRRRRQWQ